MIDAHRLAADDWIDVFDHDYLGSYLSEGGSTVKVVVASEIDRAHVRDALAGRARSRGMLFADVDAGRSKVHLLNGLFNEIAAQIPWDDASRKFMARRLVADSRRVPADGDISIDALAEENNEAKELIVRDVRSLITKYVYRDYDLSREFRAAATALAEAACIKSDDKDQRAQAVRDWLAGSLQRLSPLRTLGIYRKISRTNARQILSSTTSWLGKASYPGLLVCVDFSRYVLGKDAAPNGNIYTKGAALDMYEVLRQFIDACDELTGAAIIFLTDDEFLKNRERGLGSYEALRLRLTDDVRDRHRPNPFAPMVQLVQN